MTEISERFKDEGRRISLNVDFEILRLFYPTGTVGTLFWVEAEVLKS
jgi:hypothetical protein